MNLLVSKFHRFQNARCNDKNRNKQSGGILLPSSGSSSFLWNIDTDIPNYTASHFICP